jgi:hypothetical protein
LCKKWFVISFKLANVNRVQLFIWLKIISFQNKSKNVLNSRNDLKLEEVCIQFDW